MNQNINQIARSIIKEHIYPDAVCLDCTAGNGHDTIFLARHSKHVYGIDIQKQAIETTKARLATESLEATLILGSHDQLVSYFDSSMSFDIIVYNLGYLPHSNHEIMTTADTTVSSLRQALEFLSVKGLIVVTLYTGHDGGLIEAKAVEDFVKTLDKHDLTAQQISFLNRKQSPYIIAMQKIR
jgi:tRNA1(Val) A37 N6-methylase TrmN6